MYNNLINLHFIDSIHIQLIVYSTILAPSKKINENGCGLGCGFRFQILDLKSR